MSVFYANFLRNQSKSKLIHNYLKYKNKKTKILSYDNIMCFV